jgi:hypothetical protein
VCNISQQQKPDPNCSETSSTIGSLAKKRKIKLIGDRNRHLFLWANFSDASLVAKYLLMLPLSMLYDIIGFRKYKFGGFLWALADAWRVPAARRRRRHLWKLPDSDILARVRWPEKSNLLPSPLAGEG